MGAGAAPAATAATASTSSAAGSGAAYAGLFSSIGGLAGSLGGIATGIAESKAIKVQSEYQSRVGELNAMFADEQAADAIRRGEKRAQFSLKRGKTIISSQRASIAAQGIEVDSGSAAELQRDTKILSVQDAMQERNNAWLEANGFKARALEFRTQAGFARSAGKNASRNTLLTTGIRGISNLSSSFGNLSSNLSELSEIRRVNSKST